MSGKSLSAFLQDEITLVEKEMLRLLERGGDLLVDAADQRAQPGDQLLGLERLGEIVVGAGVEPGDAVADGVDDLSK
jgi:hypothetical protein